MARTVAAHLEGQCKGIARISGIEKNEVDTDGCPPASTCIHLKAPFWERFRLENYDFVGSVQSVNVVVVHVVVNSLPTAY